MVGKTLGLVRGHSVRARLDRLIIFNERHLRRVLREYVARYDGGRPHRARDLLTPTEPSARAGPLRVGRIVAHPVLGLHG
jgi:putative transposase